MIEWMIAFQLLSGEVEIAKTTEDICRKTAASTRYGETFQAVHPVKGEVRAVFHFCMWSRDGVIEDYVK